MTKTSAKQTKTRPATAKKATAKKATAKKATAKKATAKKATAKKATAKKATAKKATAKKPAAKKVTAKKPAAKKVTAKKATAKKTSAPTDKPGGQEPFEALPYDYDEVVARSRAALANHEGVSEQKMFGGICFMLNGNMLGGVSGKSGLMIRVGPEAHADALTQPFARPMTFTGRAMRGFVFVDAPGYANAASLRAWLDRGFRFAASLPAKAPKL